MASPRYIDLVFTDSDGAALTGLTVTFDFYADDQGNALSQPSITHAGTGHYRFTPVFGANQGIFFTANPNSATAAQKRYAGYLRPEEFNVDNVDAAASTIKAKTDLIPASPAATGDVTAARDSIKGASGRDITQAYDRIGAPAGVSISADLAAVSAKTVNLPAAPAAVGDVTAARDAIRGASSRDNTQIYDRLGAPAGASLAADIAAVSGNVTLLQSLQGSNAVVDQVVLDAWGNPASDRSRFYETAGEAEDPDNNTPLATLTYQAEWSGPGQLVRSTVTLES